MWYRGCCTNDKDGSQAIGGSRGGLQPPFGRKILPKKVIFCHFRASTPPFPDRMVDKSSHERLQPPFKKFLDPPMQAHVKQSENICENNVDDINKIIYDYITKSNSTFGLLYLQ